MAEELDCEVDVVFSVGVLGIILVDEAEDGTFDTALRVCRGCCEVHEEIHFLVQYFVTILPFLIIKVRSRKLTLSVMVCGLWCPK